MRNAIVLFATLLAAGNAAAAETADPGVKRQLDSLKLTYEVDGDNDFRIVMDVGDGRTQMAFIRSVTESYGAHRVREIWSPGYKSESDLIPEKVANRLLEHGNGVKMGGWVKQKRVAMFVVKLSADASAKALQDALEATVKSADEIEKQFTGSKDEF